MKTAYDFIRKSTYKSERLVGLHLFTRRLIHLNNEKFQIIVKRFSQNKDLFDTIDKKDWHLMQKDIIKANEMINRQKSIQVLNEIRSEINSDKMDN